MTEETIAGTPATDETELLPPTTQAAIPLAWSDVVDDDDDDDDDSDYDDDDDDDYASWRRAATDVAPILFALAAAVIAVVIIGAVMVFLRDDSPPSTPTTSPAPASTIPAAALPPISTPPPVASPPASTETSRAQDAPPRPLVFDERGIPILPENPTAAESQNVLMAIFDHFGISYSSPIGAEADAQSVCTYLDNGHHTGADLITWVQRTHPALTLDKVNYLIGAATGVYCRQYGYLLNDPSGTATS
jgi:hypothetical protein